LQKRSFYICVCLRTVLLSHKRAAKRWGRSSIWLDVDPSNAAALQLYCKQGWKQVQQPGPSWFRRLRQSQADVLMCKILPASPNLTNSCAQQNEMSKEEGGSKKEEASGAAAAKSEAGAGGAGSKVFVWGEEE
jgi:hypothetical protein